MLRSQVIVIVSALVLLGWVLNLVRKRRMREEYSWLWLAAAVFYLVMALEPEWITLLSNFLGIKNTITTLIFVGLFFIVLMLIHYSVKLSLLTTQMKDVAQQVAILDGEQYKLTTSLENRDDQESEDEAPPTPD